MLSINTNISSLITQNSLNSSTNKLNQAIERMSTGYKVNHAKDNAANYSISTNMTTKIGAYQVAEDNASMGLDMLSTANESLNLISNKLQRLRELAIQSANNTYGKDSRKAINEESRAIVDEIKRMYNTAEYNDKKLFTDETSNTAGLTTPTYTAQQVANMMTLTKAIEKSSLTSGGKYSISSAEELAKLAEIVNSGTNTSGMTFILADDIDLAEWCEDHADTGGWIAIGNSSNFFRGTLDGNGHVIENLTIDKETDDYQGLFGCTNNAIIKNVGLENVEIYGNSQVGSLVGFNQTSTITNCYAVGRVKGENTHVGGLIGHNTSSIITNCYTVVDTSGSDIYVGGLVGMNSSLSKIINSYAKGNINSSGGRVGGLVGCNHASSQINNCYSTGNVYSEGDETGGLVGRNYVGNIYGSYATGNVYSENEETGGLVGRAHGGSISNCYATSDIISTSNFVGGFVGLNVSSSIITTSYATGNVKGNDYVGGLIGAQNSQAEVSDSYALGYVTGAINYGGLMGSMNTSTTIMSNCACIDSTKVGAGKTGDVLTESEIKAKYTNEFMGFTEENGWVVINGEKYIKSLVPAGIVANTSLQIGINSNNNSQIVLNMGFSLENINELSGIGKNLDKDYLSMIDKMLETVSEKQTQLGATQNRLESILDEIASQYDNLVSSRSTLRDADMADLSSTYIQQQILQEASATLMATANQMPAIALQLL